MNESSDSILQQYRDVRRRMEEAVLPLATSVDGRHFVCQASAHGLTLRTGGYVTIDVDGSARLGQILELELVEVDGPELASSALDDTGTSVAASVRIRAVRGSGVILDGDELRSTTGSCVPATPEEVQVWLERVRPRSRTARDR